MIINKQDKQKNTFDMSIKNPGAFNILFSYINPDVTNDDKYDYIQQFFNGMNNLMSKDSYNTNLDRIVSSIDVYGLGFTLQYILNCFHKQKAIDTDIFNHLSTFFHKMHDFNPETREINIDSLITEYENILLEIGVLARLKKSFRNNILVNKKPMIQQCSSEKELNLVTNKCVKKCKPGKTRNAKFKCVSSKTRKLQKK
jgi:hypothetical protein